MSHSDVAAYRSPLRLNLGRSAILVTSTLTLAWSLYSVVPAATSNLTSDFPDYLTAAQLVSAHKPLEAFYDYPSFQREIGRAGFEHQLGGYIPQTPVTMLPFLFLTDLEPLAAKRVWFLVNCLFLGFALWCLSQLTRFTVAQLWLIAFLSYPALRQNFLLGQYYVLLLALLAAATYGLIRSQDRVAGATLGLLFALKLYGAPFALLLLAKRRFQAALSLSVVLAISVFGAVALFGWHGLTYYVTQILPRSITGETLNPFHPANNTITTFLRRSLINEPQLNPHPLVDAPWLFAFLQCGITLAILLFPAVKAWYSSRSIAKTEVAWWVIALILSSPNTASYTFILLILPVALLLDEIPHRYWPFLLIPYGGLCLPVRGTWALLFPKVWLLLFLYLRFRPRFDVRTSNRANACLASIILLLSGFAAYQETGWARKPAASAIELAASPGAIYASDPVGTQNGLFYVSITHENYSIVRQQQGSIEALTTTGNSFHPSVPDSSRRIFYEFVDGGKSSIRYSDFDRSRQGTIPLDQPDPHDPAVSHDGSKLAFVSDGKLFLNDDQGCRLLSSRGIASDPAFLPGDASLVYVARFAQRSEIMRLDLKTGQRSVLVTSVGDLARPSASRVGNRLLYGARDRGNWQVWIKDLTAGATVQLTHGRCNSTSPAWLPDGRTVVFSSDCNRGLNLPALFRVGAP